MIIELIRNKYEGNVQLHKPFNSRDIELDLDETLKNILVKSNGIEETMINPNTNELMAIAWIVYSYEEICKETSYYKENYGLDGIVFSDDGAGNPYYLFQGKVYQFDEIGEESEFVADSLEEFFGWALT